MDVLPFRIKVSRTQLVISKLCLTLLSRLYSLVQAKNLKSEIVNLK